jgi:hypothetical protein
MISWHVDKFYDFLTLFVFYKNFKQLDGKFTVMFSEHGARRFRYVPEIGRNLWPTMDIIFACTALHVSSDLQFESEFSEKI